MKTHPSRNAPLATKRQTDFIEGLARRLHMPGRMRDDRLKETYGRTLTGPTVAQASEVIDTLNGWQDIPPTVRVANGQREVF